MLPGWFDLWADMHQWRFVKPAACSTVHAPSLRRPDAMGGRRQMPVIRRLAPAITQAWPRVGRVEPVGRAVNGT